MKGVRARQKRKSLFAKPAPLPVATRPSQDWRRHALLLGVLMLATLIAYSSSFSSGFIFDNRILLQDPRILSATSENLRLIFTRDYWYSLTATGLYRPFATLTYLCNYAVFGNGPHPAGWHWVNLALHAANLALVYALGLLLLKQRVPALAMAALWALHPVLTESVTNIVGRTDLLAAFGVLAGLLCHVCAADASGRRRWAWLAGLAVAAAIGIFSKESAAVLPAVMVVYDLAFRRSSFRSLVPGYLALLAPFSIYFYARSQVLAGLPPMHISFTDNPLAGAGFWTARLTAVKIIGKYLWLLLWPFRLSCDYSYAQIPLFDGTVHSWEDWKGVLGLLACVAAAGAAIYAWRRRPLVSFLIAFFFITLAPTANVAILIGAIMAERFLYLPSIGFAGCLVMAISAACDRWGRNLAPRGWPSARLAATAFAVISIVFATRTFARNLDWHDDLSLWTSAVETSPASYKAHMARASALDQPIGAHIDATIEEIEKALAIVQSLPDDRKNPAAYIDAASYYGQKGETLAIKKPDGVLAATPESANWYRKALDSLLRAKSIEAVNIQQDRRWNLSHGKPSKDVYWYELYLELGAVYLRLDRPQDALAALEFGVRVRPVAEFFEKISSAYSALGDTHRAAIALIESLTLDTSDAQVASRLVALYRQIDPQGCSVRGPIGNAGLNMECPLVHADLCSASQNLAAIYREIGMETAAVHTSRSAVRDLGCSAAQFPGAP